MIVLIGGASHTGKTALAQRLLERLHYPYLSIDHLKMGLIRSGMTDLTPLSEDTRITALVWPIVREIVKTALENRQNLIVEGCYIPADWRSGFRTWELEQIRYICLIMSQRYIETRFDQILRFANAAEHRLDDGDCTPQMLKADNAEMMEQCRAYDLPFVLIDEEYAPENLDRKISELLGI